MLPALEMHYVGGSSHDRETWQTSEPRVLGSWAAGMYICLINSILQPHVLLPLDNISIFVTDHCAVNLSDVSWHTVLGSASTSTIEASYRTDKDISCRSVCEMATAKCESE